jgi:hypothetical protein
MAKNPAHQLAALQRAYDSGHPEIALMILAGKVRVYTRDNTPKGWPADYHKPYPQGTAAVVLMDTYPDGEPGAYYIVPIADIRRIITEQFHRDFPGGPDSRPRTPGAGHTIVLPELVQQYRDAWAFYDERDELWCSGMEPAS